MRRLLRESATDGEVSGDTTTLEDFHVIAKLRESDGAEANLAKRTSQPSF
jgi:acetyl-CoA synthetase